MSRARMTRDRFRHPRPHRLRHAQRRDGYMHLLRCEYDGEGDTADLLILLKA